MKDSFITFIIFLTLFAITGGLMYYSGVKDAEKEAEKKANREIHCNCICPKL